MSKIESFTMLDMHHALQSASGLERNVNPQPIYNAHLAITRRRGDTDGVQDRLSGPQPAKFNHQQTTQIFRELRGMSKYAEHTDGKVLREDGITSSKLWHAERILFTGVRENLPQKKQPSEPLPKHDQHEDARKPYVIRGHHLHYFADVDEESPEGKAHEIVESMALGQERVTANPDLYSVFAPWYFADAIGTTNQTQDIFTKKLETAFHEFTELPDEFPVELRPAAKDAICNSCDIGDHCALRRFPLRTTGTVEYDTSHISIFVHEAVRLGHNEGLRVISGEAKFTTMQGDEGIKTSTETVEGIRTSAKTLKTVLLESPINWSDISEPIDFKNKL